MGLRIHTNIASLAARRQLSAVGAAQGASFRRLSSGLRIAVAADDAAGLGISEGMRADLRSWGAAQRTLQDGVSIAQATEGALNEVSSILSRMRELQVQGATGTLQSEDRAVLDSEYQALVSELDRISSDTTFNDLSTLTGVPPRIGILPGIDPGGAIQVHFTDASSSGLGLSGTGVGLPFGPPDQLGLLDTAIGSINAARAQLGADVNRLQSALSSARQSSEALSNAESRIRDVDVAQETAIQTRNGIVQQAAVSILAQANSSPQLALQLLGV